MLHPIHIDTRYTAAQVLQEAVSLCPRVEERNRSLSPPPSTSPSPSSPPASLPRSSRLFFSTRSFISSTHHHPS